MDAKPGGRIRVLLVDDDPSVLETTAAVLEDEFELVTCHDPFEALRVLDTQDIDVVCTDFEMPFMNGIELLRRVAQRDHPLGAVLVTGHADAHFGAIERADKTPLPLAIVRKPYRIDHLSGALHRAGSFSRTQRAIRAIGTPPSGNAPIAGTRRRRA